MDQTTRVLVICRASAAGGPRAREAVDLALAFGAFDQQVSLLFAGDGVLNLMPGQSEDGVRSIERLLPDLPRREIIAASLTGRGALIQTRDLGEACQIANEIAPEHLELSVEEPEKWAAQIRNAGALFLGRHSSEALGDYCAGPNHVLPTSRSARFSSPLGVYDFQKRSSIIHASPEGAQSLGSLAATLALGEGLQAHARSAQFRVKQ